jgi:hypothetical protein
MYTKGGDINWRYPVEKGKSVGTSFQPVQVHVWSDSIVMSGPSNKIYRSVHVLQDILYKLKKNILIERDTRRHIY